MDSIQLLKCILIDRNSTHYSDVIMTTISPQITSLMVVYSIVYSDADQRKHQSSASLAFVWGTHRDRWIPRTKGQLRGKCFHLMTSSCTFPWYIKTQSLHLQISLQFETFTDIFYPQLGYKWLHPLIYRFRVTCISSRFRLQWFIISLILGETSFDIRHLGRELG